MGNFNPGADRNEADWFRPETHRNLAFVPEYRLLGGYYWTEYEFYRVIYKRSEWIIQGKDGGKGQQWTTLHKCGPKLEDAFSKLEDITKR